MPKPTETVEKTETSEDADRLDEAAKKSLIAQMMILEEVSIHSRELVLNATAELAKLIKALTYSVDSNTRLMAHASAIRQRIKDETQRQDDHDFRVAYLEKRLHELSKQVHSGTNRSQT